MRGRSFRNQGGCVTAETRLPHMTSDPTRDAWVGAALLAAAVVVGAGIVVVTAARVVRAEREQTLGRAKTDRPADGIVVFGAKVTREGPCAELRVRLDHGFMLWRRGVAPVLIVSGGWDGDIDEVAAMRQYLVALGVPPAAVTEARPGDNTRLTLRSVRALGDRRYVAVSTPYHAYRIAAEARRQRIDVRVDCPPTTPETRRVRLRRARLMTEVAGVILYALPDPVAVRLRAAVGGMRYTLPHVLAGTSSGTAHDQPGP